MVNVRGGKRCKKFKLRSVRPSRSGLTDVDRKLY